MFLGNNKVIIVGSLQYALGLKHEFNMFVQWQSSDYFQLSRGFRSNNGEILFRVVSLATFALVFTHTPSHSVEWKRDTEAGVSKGRSTDKG